MVGEPQGSPGWYPVNDNPRDKATFDFTVTVPAGLTVMANGVLVGHQTTAGASMFVWRERDPMAPYLATATLGKFDLTQYKVDGRIPAYVAVDPAFTNRTVLDELPSIVDFYSSVYRKYPLDAVGAIVDNAPDVGYSLESQTKPNFDHMPSEATLAHELSHQWFGDTEALAAGIEPARRLVDVDGAARTLREFARKSAREQMHGPWTYASPRPKLPAFDLPSMAARPELAGYVAAASSMLAKYAAIVEDAEALCRALSTGRPLRFAEDADASVLSLVSLAERDGFPALALPALADALGVPFGLHMTMRPAETRPPVGKRSTDEIAAMGRALDEARASAAQMLG
ncbi:hypothetical protein [Rugosimonospora africana]|uniref:Aminopeptidase N n=1 Tax=Rugosimonospora africana TaxID=556532 RepID=A0A8J3VRL0_9ACTN|nr:hypothetical protein [Rugosimonospora africana]GIH16257.1 hypothetical protein Raf01_44290 [Rugosimonospora africana]